jgi:two-component system alkaline phosphatase synthesis response regulator PhoP
MRARIVLADDELHIRRAAEFKLKREFDVVCAEDGQDAWELIQESIPDLLITDLQMPRMTGIELIEQVRANAATADLPVILLTAKGFELSKDHAFGSLKVLELVSKPFSPRELCNTAQAALQNAIGPATTEEVQA